VGQKPKLKLLVRAVDSQGRRITAIPALPSDDFVVRLQSMFLYNHSHHSRNLHASVAARRIVAAAVSINTMYFNTC